jgi:hypothetical protein
MHIGIKKQVQVTKTETEIEETSQKIQTINKYIQQASGLEQRTLRDQIAKPTSRT